MAHCEKLIQSACQYLSLKQRDGLCCQKANKVKLLSACRTHLMKLGMIVRCFCFFGWREQNAQSSYNVTQWSFIVIKTTCKLRYILKKKKWKSAPLEQMKSCGTKVSNAFLHDLETWIPVFSGGPVWKWHCLTRHKFNILVNVTYIVSYSKFIWEFVKYLTLKEDGWGDCVGIAWHLQAILPQGPIMYYSSLVINVCIYLFLHSDDSVYSQMGYIFCQA